MQQHHSVQGGHGSALARGLGWFSIALGAAELAAPGTLARVIGLNGRDPRTISLLRLYGARELATGVAILAQPDQPGWLWARVGGDALDLASLRSAISDRDGHTARLWMATAAVAGVTALDVMAARQLSSPDGMVRQERGQPGIVHVRQAVTIGKPAAELYRFWHRFETLPQFTKHLESVEVTGDRRSRWCAIGPAGVRVEWEAEITEEREPELIAWRSLPDSDVQNRGQVRFVPAPAGRGTEVHVDLEYESPAGTMGRSIAWMMGKDPAAQVREDLRRFKQLMETGVIPLSEGPGLWRAAQPAPNPETVRSLAGVQR